MIGDYPEHKKMLKASSESQVLHDFFEWIRDNGIEYEFSSQDCCDEGVPYSHRLDDLINQYFEIDTKAIEEERREMLAELQKRDAEKRKK